MNFEINHKQPYTEINLSYQAVFLYNQKVRAKMQMSQEQKELNLK